MTTTVALNVQRPAAVLPPAAAERPLTVLFVADKLSYDGRLHGIGRYFMNIVPALASCGARVIPCALRRRDAAAGLLDAAGVRVRYLGKRRFDPTTLWSVVRMIRRERVDVLHVQDYGSTAFGVLAGWFTGVPVVVQEHVVPPRVPHMARLIDRLLGRRIARTLAVSESVRAHCFAKRRRQPEATEVVYLGTPRPDDPDAIIAHGRRLRRSLGVPNDAPLIGTVTRLHEQKGIRYLLDAAPAVLRRFPEARFLIIGDGPQRQALEAQAEAPGLSSCVRFLGFQDHAQAWMAGFDLVVMPSLWEGTPQTAFEAMALGKPIVASGVDGLAEVLRDGETAKLVPPRDPARLAEAIMQLLEHPEECARIAASAKAASAAFDTAETARTLLARYRAAITDLQRSRGGRTRAARRDMSPRVCLLTETFAPVIGGGETQVRLLAERLIERGAPAFVVTRRSAKTLTPRELVGTVPVYRVGPCGFPRYGKYLMLLPAIQRLINERARYDLICVSGFRVLGAAGMLAGRWLGKPVVLKADCEGEFSGTFVRADARVATHLWLARLSQAWLAWRNRLLRRGDLFVSISSRIEEELVRHGVRPSAIQSIPNAIDVRVFHPVAAEEKPRMRSRLGLPLEAFLVAYTGKLIQGKGLELLLRVWKDVTARHPEARLMLIGSGAGQFLSCEDALRASVREHQLSDRVEFIGAVSDVHRYLQAADLYVFPSEREALPSALLEALACGLPVIATRVGAIPDVIDGATNGLLVEPNAAEALRHAICHLIEHRGAAQALGAKGRESVERFSIDRIAEAYLDAFRAVLAAGANASSNGRAN